MCWGSGNITSLASHSDPVIRLFLTFIIQPLYSFSYLLLRKPKLNEVKLSNYFSYSSIITEKGGASWTSAAGSRSLSTWSQSPRSTVSPGCRNQTLHPGLVARIQPRDSLPGMGLRLGRREPYTSGKRLDTLTPLLCLSVGLLCLAFSNSFLHQS